MTYTLFDFPLSAPCWRVRIALTYKGLDWQSQQVHPLNGDSHKPEYLAVNPQGKIPALRLPSGEVITQSYAILQYLEEAHPEPSLFPVSEPMARARIRAVMEVVGEGQSVGASPIALRTVARAGLDAATDAGQAERLEWLKESHRFGMESLEKLLHHLEPNGAGAHGLYNKMTMADCAIIPAVFTARRWGADTSAFPRCEVIYDHCMTHPNHTYCAETHPEKYTIG